MIPAMTTFLGLLALLAAVEIVAGLRLVRQDRPAAPPPSHRDWAPAGLPSTPYADRPG
jgi:hypothetical protein